MNKLLKVGFGVAAAAAVAFAAGCAEHAPAYQCGKVDYKSMSSCKQTNCKGYKRMHQNPQGQ